jgi:hypothetical protein
VPAAFDRRRCQHGATEYRGIIAYVPVDAVTTMLTKASR